MDQTVSQVPSLLNAAQAAELLNVPKSWVLAQARRGAIPHIRLGRYVRFDQSAVETWWRCQGAGPQPHLASAA